MSTCSHQRLAGAVFGLGLLSVAPLALAADADLAKNKALVQGFWNDVFIARNVDAASRYLRPDYIQHDPHVQSGLKAFQDFFRQAFAQTPPNFKAELVKSVAEGDLVVTYSQFSGTDPQGKPFTGTGFDMYRIQGGLIAEHWDQIEPDS
jgi:predicted SnoaL-like aldol condensation-catalyzing enzyme